MRAIFAASALAFAFTLLPAVPAAAQEREAIGTGRLFSNDIFGDGRDRWRTGSYVVSFLRARDAFTGLSEEIGDIIEYRLRAEIIAPSVSPADRPYVGASSAGVHTHFGSGPLHFSAGADVTFIGPQTGLASFQEKFHDVFDLPAPRTNGDPLGNDVALSAGASATLTYPLTDTVTLRPFAEATTGVEDLFRVGGDVLIGTVGQDDLLLRDVVTGQLYRGTEGPARGLSYTFGADFAAVGGSLYLPEDRGYVASETRTRARAGVHWQPSEDVSFFYGVTYLSEEFTTQPEGQVLGSLKLNFNF